MEGQEGRVRKFEYYGWTSPKRGVGVLNMPHPIVIIAV